MNPDEMTPEEINAAIHALRGYRHQKGEEPTYGGTYLHEGWFTPDGKFEEGGPPNYHGSRDAMAFAGDMLKPTEVAQFVAALVVMRKQRDLPEYRSMSLATMTLVVFATAAQRARAFLKTKGRTA